MQRESDGNRRCSYPLRLRLPIKFASRAENRSALAYGSTTDVLDLDPIDGRRICSFDE